MRRPLLKNKSSLLPIFGFAALIFAVPHFAHAGWVQELITGGIGELFEWLILPLASAILTLAGLLLDSAIDFSLHTAYIFSLSPAINLGWTIVRDLCNIFFIFILIYISLGTIVRGTSFGTKSLLTKVIIAALLINFSLFFTKAVVDVSNVFGLWLYGGITNTLRVNTGPATLAKGEVASLSDLISARLGIAQWWKLGGNSTGNTSDPKSVSEYVNHPSSSFIARILRLVIVMIAIYIFLYCAVLFISRSVTLLFLLVFSPVGFMGEVLPQLSDYSKDWKKELTSAVMFPIAFLLMLYISLQFINSLKILNIAALNDETLVGGISISLYFQYAIIIFMLHACLSVAKDNSGKMGKAVGGFAEGLGKFAVGIAGGAPALLGKVALGGAAARLAGNTRLNSLIAGGGVGGAIAGKVQGGLKGAADFHFDARALTGVAGKPGKGYTSMMKDNEKQQKEALEKLAAKPKDTKPAKSELSAAEDTAYGGHGEYGKAYDQQNTRTKTAQGVYKQSGSPDDLKEYNKQKKALESIKAAVDADGEYDIKKRIHAEQVKILEQLEDIDSASAADLGAMQAALDANTDITDAERTKQERRLNKDDRKAMITAMKAAMRQGDAALAAEEGLGMGVAQFISKGLGENGLAAKFGNAIGGEIGKSAVQTIGNIVTQGAGLAADKFISDNKKLAGELRKTIDSKKQKEKDLSKLIANLNDDDAGGDAGAKPSGGGGGPAPEPTPVTPGGGDK